MSTVEVLLSHDNAVINKEDFDDDRPEGFLKTGSRYGGLPRPRSECCFPRMEILAPSPDPGKPGILSPSQTMTSLHRASIVSSMAPFNPPCPPVSPAGLTLSVTPATPAVQTAPSTIGAASSNAHPRSQSQGSAIPTAPGSHLGPFPSPEKKPTSTISPKEKKDSSKAVKVADKAAASAAAVVVVIDNAAKDSKTEQPNSSTTTVGGAPPKSSTESTDSKKTCKDSATSKSKDGGSTGSKK